MVLFRKSTVISVLAILLFINVLNGQQTPLTPISYRIFSPFIFNPAIAGSKDYASLDIIAAWSGKYRSQMISENLRLVKTGTSYFGAKSSKAFTNFGFGLLIFNENINTGSNRGASASLSYQSALNKKALSFLSFGATVKGVYNTIDSVPSTDPFPTYHSKNTFYPNIDLGVYYYAPNLYAGLSATNILSTPQVADTTDKTRIAVSRQYFFVAGYKILLDKKLNVVLEPSLIVNGTMSKKVKSTNILKPMIKLYVEDFCLGTYLNTYNKISFFIQYRFPRFYIASFFELPKETPYYKHELNAEFAFGLNFNKANSKNQKYYHW